LAILIPLYLLVACSSPQNQVTSLPPTHTNTFDFSETPETVTVTPNAIETRKANLRDTQFAEATSTEAVTVTVRNAYQATKSYQMSQTPQPSWTSTPTPTAPIFELPTELPTWMRDPSSQIIFFTYDAYSIRSSEIGFFNAASGEQAIIRLPHKIYQYYWKDTNHIVFLEGYCAEPIERVTELDILQGTLSPSTAENLPWYIASCYGIEEETSATIRIDATSSEPTIEILDPSSETWLRVTDPNDGISDIHFSLSPNNDYLGVVQIQGEYDFSELWRPLFGTQVSVYHMPDRQLVASFAEEKAVSAMLLFTDNENLVYVRENTPCVISIATASKQCVNTFSDRFPASTIILGEPLSNGTKFSFLYFSDTPHQGGWCIYNLLSGEINCPTDEFEDLQEQTVVNYALSPDNNYLLIEYASIGCPPPWCDVIGNRQIAIIDIVGNKFLKLGDANTYQTLDIFRTTQPWRPMP
jgi:hypothetical protein